MLKLLFKKGIGAFGLLLIVSFLIFFILQLIPGDAAQLKMGMDGSPEAVAEYRHQMGLDRTWYIRYFDWLGGVLQGDLGQSSIYSDSVTRLIADRLPITLSLVVLTTFISIAVAVPLGVISAVKANSWIDYACRTLMQAGMAVPSFWIAILLILILAVYVPIFPPGGYVPVQEGFWPFLKSLILPALSLSIIEIGILLRMVRVSMLEVLKQDHMRFALSKGLNPARLYIRYGLRNALIAPVTLIGMQIGGLLAGAIVIEEVFALPGIGRLILVSVEQRDTVLLEGLALFVTGLIIVINLVIELLYKRLDPRVELS